MVLVLVVQQKTRTILLVQVASNIGDHRWWYNVVVVDAVDADDAVDDADVGGDYYSDDYDDDYKDNSSVE